MKTDQEFQKEIDKILKKASWATSRHRWSNPAGRVDRSMRRDLQKGPWQSERSEEGYHGMPGGLEVSDEGEMEYPDPTPLEVPEVEVEERVQTGEEPVWMELGESIQEYPMGELGPLSKTDGFRLYIVEDGKYFTVGGITGEGRLKDWEKFPHGKTMTWEKVLDNVLDLSLKSDWYAEEYLADPTLRVRKPWETVKGFVTYQQLDGEEKKVFNFRNFNKEMRPMGGTAEGTVLMPSRFIAQTVGEFSGKEFSPDLIRDILHMSKPETLYGEVDNIYPPDLYPEDGPVSDREIPMGGSEELDRVMMGLEDSEARKIVRKLTKLADGLDKAGLHSLADLVDEALEKIAAQTHVDSRGTTWTMEGPVSMPRGYVSWRSDKGIAIRLPEGATPDSSKMTGKGVTTKPGASHEPAEEPASESTEPTFWEKYNPWAGLASGLLGEGDKAVEERSKSFRFQNRSED